MHLQSDLIAMDLEAIYESQSGKIGILNARVEPLRYITHSYKI